jgi:uncharacterized protein (DUF3820 family)
VTETEATMPFGKHRGKPLSEVPRPYLEYLATWDQLWPDTRAQVLDELRRRGLPFSRRFKNVPLHEVPPSYLRWVQANFDELLPPWDELLALGEEPTTSRCKQSPVRSACPSEQRSEAWPRKNRRRSSPCHRAARGCGAPPNPL